MKTIQVDMSKVNSYTNPAEDIVKKSLRANTLFNKNCLYTVIDGEKLEALTQEETKAFLQTGTYTEDDTIHAFTKDNLTPEDPNDPNSPRLTDLLNSYYRPAIVVYKAADFELGCTYDYTFKNPDKKLEAVLAILELNWKKPLKSKLCHS